MHLVKELNGHSGATVNLYSNNTVVKSNYPKSRESADILNKLPFPTPKILEVSDTSMTMEYINGLDMATYLETEDINPLIEFLSDYISWCLQESILHNFKSEIDNKIDSLMDHINLLGLIDDTVMPKSLIHGDLTLENILWYNGDFYFIDANPTDLSSVYFDANKLRQDLDCLWFVRNHTKRLDIRIACRRISEKLKKRFHFMRNDDIMVFMLSRILPYSKTKSDREFLYREINKWR
jgi:tRNA A-37 threonylcarbamoyl transferase component Bud32